MKVIELKNPETLPAGIYRQDQATHLRICKYEEEIYRPGQYRDKPGHFIVYTAKCFKQGGVYIEIPNWPGEEFKIEGREYDEMRNIKTTAKLLADDITEIIAKFLIDKGRVEGKLVD
jgi:hypothetical protein